MVILISYFYKKNFLVIFSTIFFSAYIRGALRFLKKLTHCGIKRKVEEDMTIEEFMATPLIRWVKVCIDTISPIDTCMTPFLNIFP